MQMKSMSKFVDSTFIIFWVSLTICSGLSVVILHVKYFKNSKLNLSLYLAATLPNNKTSDEESQIKIQLVEEIIRKVCNISLNVFSNKTPAEKGNLLIKIEDKLNKSARALGIHGQKYVKLIMKGVKLKAFENDLDKNNVHAVENYEAGEKKNILRASNAKASNTKGNLVENIAKKIEILAKNYLSHAKNYEHRLKMIEHIKSTFLQSADRKQALLQNKEVELKNYIDLVTKGIELVMKKDAIKRRRWDFVYTNNINLNKDSQDRLSAVIAPVKTDPLTNNELEPVINVSKPKSVILTIDDKSISNPNNSCESILEESCSKIKLLKTLRCLSDNREFNILKLCDGVGDCLDFSDEDQCGQQAIETIQRANKLLTYMDTSINALHCFPDLFQKSMFSKQNNVLGEVLKNQLTFLEKHNVKKTKLLSRRVYSTEKKVVMETVNEAVNVVDSLTSALGTSICPNFEEDKERNTRIDKKELEKLGLGLSIEPTTEQARCKCNGQNCLQSCSPRCERICLDMYSLSQFSCDAITGQNIVSLDMLCDGKIDCYDELDEKDCIGGDISLAKFEATQMYDYVLKDIKFKTVSMSSEVVRSRLQNLHALVTKLQKNSIKRYPDILEVKRVRQACFEELSKVYDTALFNLKTDERYSLRFFLITQNERLISALKRSHTGNDKIISSDGCVCRDNKCALPRCSKSCNRACSAEPQLTRFFCTKLSDQLNNTVPIELVCNGKENCPNGEDEKNCQKEMCRMYHIKLLRRKLQDVGKKQAGTALGEALRSWRVKVTAALMIAEESERPSPLVLYVILNEMLHDLVMTYASLEDRKDNSPIFKEFFHWSRVVIDTLKTCTQ